MRRTLNLPPDLLAAARAAARSSGRTLDAQIAFWAALGRKREARASAPPKRKLSLLMDGIDSPEGRRLALAFFRSGPYPRYEAAPGRPGLVVRITAKGRRVVGRFDGRRFTPVR